MAPKNLAILVHDDVVAGVLGRNALGVYAGLDHLA